MAKFLDETGLSTLWGLVKAEDAKGVKIATGSYTGTGKHGTNNKNSLTFPFSPKVVFVGWPNTRTEFTNFIAVNSGSTVQRTTSGGSGTLSVPMEFSFSADGKTLYWFSEMNSEQYQNNKSGVVYNYVAIG